MRRIIFGIILVGIAVSAVAQMLRQPSAESDALFAVGVDLYNKGKYREAIPLFAKSDSLDKAQINPSSNRRDYSSMWLASCYYKLGDTLTAADIDANYYRFAPVDRRLTVKSDSLLQIGVDYIDNGDYTNALEYLTQCAKIEKSVAGDKHIWYGNTIYGIFSTYYNAGDFSKALKYNTIYADIMRDIYGSKSREYIISTANLGMLYHYLSLCDSALNCLTYAYDHLDRLDSDKQYLAYHIANEYNTIASNDSSLNKINTLKKARFYLKNANTADSTVQQLHTDVEKNIALTLVEEAVKERQKRNYKKAIPTLKEAIITYKNLWGKDNLYYTTIMSLLANSESMLGNYKEAIRLETEALQIYEKLLGREHPDYATSLSNLAGYNLSLGNYTEAIRLETEALRIREKVLGKEHPDYATSLNNLALYNFYIGNYPEAIQLGTEALKIYEKLLGREHPDYATSLSNLAGYNSSLGNYTEAIRLETETLRIREKVLGKENPDYATFSHNLAIYNSYIANYRNAIQLETEALQIREKILGKEHPYYATSLASLASYNSAIGNYTDAIRLATEALQIQEKVFGKEHPDCATSLACLASYNSAIGNYTDAIRLGTEALQIQEKIFGKEHPDCATSLSNLAGYNSDIGNYTDAIRLGTEALQIQEKIFGKEHPDCATSLNLLSQNYYLLGDYVKAARLLTEALNNLQKTLGTEHPTYASSLEVLAACYASLENYAEAIRIGEKALDIEEQIFGKGHVNTSMYLNNLAYYNSLAGNYSEAIHFGTEALKIREKAYGKKSINYATSLNNLGKYNYYLGNYSEAIRMGEEALAITENILGKNHPNTAKSLENLATYNWKIGNADAVGYCVEATEALREIVRRTFADLTARERNLFWDKYKAWFEGTIHSIAYDMPLDSLAENGYNGALMAKGLLLNSEMELSTLLKESGDEEVANIYNNLKNLRLQINKLYEMPIAERPLDADSLERAAQGLERQLVQRSKVYGDYTANLVIDWKQVRQKLGSGEMAVEFVSFPLRNDSVMYAAYCLRKDMPLPKMVPLFEERQLTSIDKRLYLSSPMLYNLVWKPLEKEMAGVTTVYFAPSGELYNLPVENLPVDGNTYNSDLRSYRRLSSSRQLALRRDGVEVARAAVYGGLKYDTDTVTLANDSRKYRTAEPVQWSSRAVADSLNLRDGVYELPATKIEAEEIDKALETARIDTKLYTDTIGTEASFKALSGSGVNALHIATHGFYWTEREATQLDGLAFLGTDMPTVVQEDKALTRSGLLFAGANTALKGLPLPDGVEDGVLTAKEIAALDLRSLDLVALSACQTGLGEITGDGVFGLQRGFKKAGTNTLLMSLWKVDDTATQLLMTQFYKNLLSGMGKYEALAAAQKYLRELEVEVKITPDTTNYQKLKDERDGKQEEVKYKTLRKYAAPKYWAAFVLLDGVN